MKKLGLLEQQSLVFIVNDYSYSSSVFEYENKPWVENTLSCSGKFVWDIEDEIEIRDLFSEKKVEISLKEMKEKYNFEDKYTFGVFEMCNDYVDIKLGVSNNIINNILSANCTTSNKMPFYLNIIIPKSDSWKEGENAEIHEFRISF